MYGLHKQGGQVLEYLVPLHVGAASLHALRGQAIFARINPFSSAAVLATAGK